jgi:hypothetical protein
MAPNKSLELTPSVGAFQSVVTSVGIGSSIESSWERSSAPSRWADGSPSARDLCRET